MALMDSVQSLRHVDVKNAIFQSISHCCGVYSYHLQAFTFHVRGLNTDCQLSALGHTLPIKRPLTTHQAKNATNADNPVSPLCPTLEFAQCNFPSK